MPNQAQMPVAPASPSLPPFTTAPAGPAFAGRAAPGMPQTLLLVEDSRLAAEAVRLACRRLGIRLRRAETLASAMLHLRVYRPDVALIDPGLPDGSGLSLIAALARQAGRAPRVVAISGDPAMADACRNAGAEAFVEKPLNLARDLVPLFGDAVVPPAVRHRLMPAAATPANRRIMAPGAGLAGCRSGADGGQGDPSVGGTGSSATSDSGAPGRVAGPERMARNAGSDPLALSDDLRRAHRLLLAAREPSEFGYATQFLRSVARCAGDAALLRAIRQSRQSGDPAPLLAALAERTAHIPLV